MPVPRQQRANDDDDDDDGCYYWLNAWAAVGSLLVLEGEGSVWDALARLPADVVTFGLVL